MTTVLFMIGAVVAAVLLGLLVLTLLFRSFRIWPTPGPGRSQAESASESPSPARLPVLRV